MAQLDGGGGSSSAPSRGGGGRRPQGPPLPGRNAPAPTPRFDTPVSRSGGRAPSLPTPQRPPVYADIEQLLRSQRPAFDMNAVQTAREKLDAAQKAAANQPNYSSYTEPEARVTTEFSSKKGREAAANQPDIKRGLLDSPAGQTMGAERDKAAATLEHALRAQREHALGLDGMGKAKHGDVEQMSWEQYNALPEKQRAAIDFNTALVRAVRRDRKLQDDYDPTEVQDASYDKAVEGMFGDDGGSDLYAPETVALLKQIKFDDTSADLDDFLGLHAAITAKDLKHLKVEQGPTLYEAEANPVQRDRYNLTENLATSQQKLEMKLAQGRQFIDSINRTTIDERNEHVALLGGVAKDPATMLGFGQALNERGEKTIDGFFQEGFEALANKANAKDTDEILGTISSQLSPQEMESFMAYANARTQNTERFNLRMGPTKGVNYLKPEDFRKMLGLDGGGPDAP